MDIKTFVCITGFVTIGYYVNDIKNVPKYSGYQNTYKGLNDHIIGIMAGVGIILISIFI